MPPIPDYLIFFILVFVIIPTIAAIVLRLILYQHLASLQNSIERLIKGSSRGQQPKIIENLEQRFRQARKNLEQVNTTALIEQVYSREKIGIFTWEGLNYFCRILPNLLLIFGLFGTFLGITINLTSLSQTINQANTSDINSLVSELQTPLQGMSIAFTTSLAAIISSAILTIFNSIINTNIAKYKLINSLEDYLDNIYQYQIPNINRLDIIVNRMVSQQDEFLSRFGVTVRDAVESSMGNVATQIAQGNKEVTQLATQVYERFTEAAGTISAAANEFKSAMQALKTNAEIFKQAGETFAKSRFADKLSAATENLANIQNLFAQSAGSLAETVTSIDTAVTEIQRCSQEIIILATEVNSTNQTSVEVLELHKSNQTSLSTIIPQLKQGASSFSKSINKLDKLEKRIEQRADSLNGVIESLTQLLEYVQAHTNTIESNINTLNQQFANQNQTFLHNLEGHFNQIGVKFDTFKVDYEELFNSNNTRIVEGYRIVGESMIKLMREQIEQKDRNFNSRTENYQQMYHIMANKFEELISKLSEMNGAMNDLKLINKQMNIQNNQNISNEFTNDR